MDKELSKDAENASSANLTSVEWLFDHLVPHLDWSKFEDRELFRKLKAEAKAMEKEQKIKFAKEYAESGSFYCNGEFAIEKDAEDYYNETFKNK